LINDWPRGGLEPVDHCPVCGSSARSPVYECLVDHAFGVAPGSWVLVGCTECGTRYLDPRPTQETIGLAYAKYYTHQAGSTASGGFFGRLRRGVANSYLNGRFGLNRPDALFGGHALAYLLPRLRGYLNVTFGRHLPAPAADARRLLDVGCGNGEFLLCAAAMGWDAQGIDVDAQAVAAARQAGCRARQASVQDLVAGGERFHHIVMSHVIEHVPDPVGMLHQCLQLLEPGGRLWLETPNVDATGHKVFGGAWRGLEPPRHLVLFNRASLAAALVRAGFEQVQFKSHPAVALFMWAESRRIQRLMSPADRPVRARPLSQRMFGAAIADYVSIIRPGSSEFITCVARRPEDTR